MQWRNNLSQSKAPCLSYYDHVFLSETFYYVIFNYFIKFRDSSYVFLNIALFIEILFFLSLFANVASTFYFYSLAFIWFMRSKFHYF